MQDPREKILTALKQYNTVYQEERPFIAQTISFVEQNATCFERYNLTGHITGSAWILSPDGKKALLTHHKKLGSWLQLGGHSDGDSDTWNVSLREAQEESGIMDIKFVSHDIFDIDVHTIPENPKKNEPIHLHYDVRFLLQTASEDFVVSDESNNLKWVSLAEISKMEDLLNQSVKRMIEKWQEYPESTKRQNT